MIAVQAMPIPGLDAVVDTGAPIAPLWYWYTLFRDLRANQAKPRAPQTPAAEAPKRR
jgi:hypothetical protein